jgi:outer membrane protein assembly factor BamB
MKLWAWLLACSVGYGADWPRFRGPNGDGVAPDDKAPAAFGLEQNLAWKTKTPQGNSSPILVNGRMFLSAHEGDERMVLCLDAASGKELWRKSIRKARTETANPLNGPATPTPATDGKNVFVFFPEFGLVSYGWDGAERWRTPLGPFDAVQGVATSPVYAEGNVILFLDQPTESYLVAFDAANGKQRWKVERPSGFLGGYSTPSLYQPKNGPQQLIVAGAVELTGYQAKTGERLWWARGLTLVPAALPLVQGDTIYTVEPRGDAAPPFAQVAVYDANKDGKVSFEEVAGEKLGDKIWNKILRSIDKFFGDGDGAVNEEEWKKSFTSGDKAGGLNAFAIGGTGDLSEKGSRWNVPKGMPYVTAPLLYRDVLYVVRNGGIWSSYHPATGEKLKEERLKDALGEYYASPVAAGGKLYLVSKEGKLTVVKAGAQWEAEASVDLNEQVIATPAVVNGRLYVRTAQATYCFGS